MRLAGVELRGKEELVWLVPVAAATMLLYVAAGIAGAPYGLSTGAIVDDYGWKALRALPMLIQVAALVLLGRALLSGSRSPLRTLLQPFRGLARTPMLTVSALAPLVLMPMLFTGFGIFKMLMPLHTPFAWDDAFAAADRALFFGNQPWELTHALFGSAGATGLLDRVYSFWVLLLSFAILGFALLAPRYDRARFFLSFTAAWLVLGVAGAWLGASAGPCYTALVGASSAGEFAPLMAKLQAYAASDGAHLDAVRWQGVLWEAHAERRYGFGMGISAMPSLHNAIAVLYALAFFRFGRMWGAAGTAFALVIFVGSVHLGWHYAVDGIVAAAAMAAIWWGAGRYLERSGYAAAVAAPSDPAPEPLSEPGLAAA
jgi:hypothetical protein